MNRSSTSPCCEMSTQSAQREETNPKPRTTIDRGRKASLNPNPSSLTARSSVGDVGRITGALLVAVVLSPTTTLKAIVSQLPAVADRASEELQIAAVLLMMEAGARAAFGPKLQYT